MRKLMLKMETALTLPFFLLSWLLCSVFYAVLAGRTLAKADGGDKEKVLEELFGKKKAEDEAAP